MAELHNVYDLFFPTPPPLQETASVQVALGLWRQEIKQQRINNTLYNFDWPSNLPLSTLIPNAPPGILPIIEKYVKKVGASMKMWLEIHISRDTFRFEIVNFFDDFVCDLDGDIHGERTAKRMILCDKISDKVKFNLACWYCFKDDIYKFWPLVSSDVNLDSIDIHTYTSSFYWISYLKNNVDSISMDFEHYEVSTVEERVVNEILIYADECWPATRYFWNSLDSDAQMRCLTRNHASYEKGGDIICRYILAKLNEKQLKELIREKLSDLGSCLLYICIGVYSSIEMWTYIKHKLDKEQFVSFARYLLKQHIECTEKALYLREIWTSAPKNLKLAAVPEILLDKPVFQIDSFFKCGAMRNKNIYFLLAVLSDASIKDRRIFLNDNWRDLFIGSGPIEYQRLPKICGLKTKHTSEYENIRQPCQILLEDARFEELREFLTFFCTNEQTIREMKLKVLSDDFAINSYHICEPFSLNRFIEDAYNDVNLANEFKSQLLVSSQTISKLKNYVEIGRFQRVIDFVDTLAPSEEIAEMVKKREIFPAFTSTLMDESNRRICVDNMTNFMRWCLGSDDEIERFKQSFSVDDLILHLRAAEKGKVWDETETRMRYCIRICNLRRDRRVWGSFLLEFLQWYFVTKEDFEKFKKKYSRVILFSKVRRRINELYLMKLE